MKTSSPVDIKHTSKLANLPLSPEEEKTYSEQLTKILEYIDQIEKGVKTVNTQPTFNVAPIKNITRIDKESTSLTQEEALKNAPQSENGFFKTKGVFENE